MEFADVARELLLVAPDDFIAERTARQRGARKDDRALSTAIGKLRKPAPAAWVIDLLAHDGALDEAVELGPALRAAQASADPKAIAQLRRQRAQVVDALAQAGASLAEDAGHPVTPAVLEQVRATIEAAMADPHAGAAVRSGLLVRALESVGFEDVDLDGALADPDAVPDAWSGSDAPPIPITAGRHGSRRRGTSRSADTGPETDTRSETDTETETETAAQVETGADANAEEGADATRGAAGTAATTGRRRGGGGKSSRASRTTARDPEPERDPAAERRDARAAEAAARQASRDADAALDAAEADLERVEEQRADLDRRRRELERELARIDRDRAALDEDTERLEHVRDDAEAASDRAREELVAARRRRRTTR